MCCVPLQLTDSSAQIRSYVFDVVRASVPNINLDEVFTVSGQQQQPSSAGVPSWLSAVLLDQATAACTAACATACAFSEGVQPALYP